jgi:hypothetical protein
MIQGWVDRLKSNKIPVVLLGLVVVAAVLIVVFWTNIFPAEKLADAIHIGNVAKGLEEPMDEKYGLVAGIYRTLGLANLEMLVGLISVGLMVVMVFWIFRRNKQTNLISFAVAATAIICSAMFFGGFSKELFEIILVCVGGLLALEWKKWGWLALGGVILLYGAIFRPYWLVIGALYFGWLVLLRCLKQKPTWMIWLITAVMIVGAVAGYAIVTKGDDISAIRSAINHEGRVSYTKMDNLLPSGNVVNGMVNSLATFVWFFLPWQLLIQGGVFYVGGAVVVAGIMWIFVWWLTKSRKIGWKPGVEMALALILAFLVVSSLFEPDFRSFLRHLTPVMLFMVYCYNASLKRIEEKKP